MTTHLAFDFGASSGRAIVGELLNGKLTLQEIHRFENAMMHNDGHHFWNIAELYGQIKQGLAKCAELKIEPQSIGIDTWGVDFSLVSEDGKLPDTAYAYRDKRTSGMMEQVFKGISKEEIYRKTGIQFLEFNSIYQLASMVKDKSELLQKARDLLFIPDIFHYLLTGKKTSEFSFATTSQLYNPHLKDWDKELFTGLGLDISLMQKIVEPATIIGEVSDEIARETGFAKCPVVAVGTHDTASAIAAVPAKGQDWAYISSGTWSLMGIESDKPVINEQALKYNFTNEGGVGNRFRVLKNISGLWLLQQCRKIWSEKEDVSFAEIIRQAELAEPHRTLINPDDASFTNPENMVVAIGEYCRKTGQAVPDSIGSMARCILESLALKYCQTMQEIKRISPSPINKLHIIGGGILNKLLNQFTANACNMPVLTGPIEATAIGNLLVQAMALGEISDLNHLRQIVKDSVEVDEYYPEDTNDWKIAYQEFIAHAERVQGS